MSHFIQFDFQIFASFIREPESVQWISHQVLGHVTTFRFQKVVKQTENHETQRVKKNK